MSRDYVLVTGGAGFIGSHTVIQLIDAGYSPVIMDLFSNSSVECIHRLEKITGRLQKVLDYNSLRYKLIHVHVGLQDNLL